MGTINFDYLRCFTENYTKISTRGSFINLVPRVCLKNRTERANFFANLCLDFFPFFISSFVCLKFMLAMRNVLDSNESIEKM